VVAPVLILAQQRGPENLPYCMAGTREGVHCTEKSPGFNPEKLPSCSGNTCITWYWSFQGGTKDAEETDTWAVTQYRVYGIFPENKSNESQVK
jgi:hypothetical protein